MNNDIDDTNSKDGKLDILFTFAQPAHCILKYYNMFDML